MACTPPANPCHISQISHVLNGRIKPSSVVLITPYSGWTIFDRLYLLNGTLYVVTDEPASVPDRLYILSSATFITSDPAEAALRAPTDKNMRVISTAEARQLFGTEADRLDGVTVSLYPSPNNHLTHATPFVIPQWLAYDPKQL